MYFAVPSTPLYPATSPPLRYPQEIVVQDEMRDVTLEAIAGVFFGDYATPEFMEDIKRLLPAISSGLFSIPVGLPWSLTRLPVFGYGRSMDAREAFKLDKFDILNVLEERRADLASAKEGTNSEKSAGLVDSLIVIQQNQMGTEDGQDGSFDDDFIVENVRTDRSITHTDCCFTYLRFGPDCTCNEHRVEM